MSARIRCVVFDVDDTLYLEVDYIRSGFAAVGSWVSERFGVEGFAKAAWELHVRGVRGRIFDQLVETLALPSSPSLIPELVALYRRHRPSIALAPDARRCLDRLHGRLPLAGVTDGPETCQAAKVEALELRRWLEPVVLTARLGPGAGKPSPQAFALVQSRTGLPPESHVYVADNARKDFAGPKQLGWRTVRLHRQEGLYRDIPSDADVDDHIESLDELECVLDIDPA